jgi:hypothetical protein
MSPLQPCPSLQPFRSQGTPHSPSDGRAGDERRRRRRRRPEERRESERRGRRPERRVDAAVAGRARRRRRRAHLEEEVARRRGPRPGSRRAGVVGHVPRGQRQPAVPGADHLQASSLNLIYALTVLSLRSTLYTPLQCQSSFNLIYALTVPVFVQPYIRPYSDSLPSTLYTP